MNEDDIERVSRTLRALRLLNDEQIAILEATLRAPEVVVPAENPQ